MMPLLAELKIVNPPPLYQHTLFQPVEQIRRSAGTKPDGA